MRFLAMTAVFLQFTFHTFVVASDQITFLDSFFYKYYTQNHVGTFRFDLWKQDENIFGLYTSTGGLQGVVLPEDPIRVTGTLIEGKKLSLKGYYYQLRFEGVFSQNKITGILSDSMVRDRSLTLDRVLDDSMENRFSNTSFGSFEEWAEWAHPAHKLLDTMTKVRKKIDQANEKDEEAEGWFELNKTAGNLQRVIRWPVPTVELCHDPNPKTNEVLPTCPGKTYADQAQKLGIDMSYCGSGEAWLASPNGYQEYLKLLPDGSRADKAWWMVRIEPPCCDECTPHDTESYQYMIGLYKEFLAKFPHSDFYAWTAKLKIEEYQTKMKSEGPFNNMEK